MLVFRLLWLPSDQLKWLGSSCQMKKPCRKRLSSQKVRRSRLPVYLSAEWSTWHKNDPQRNDAKEICAVSNSPPPPSKKKSVQRFQTVLELPWWVFRCQKCKAVLWNVGLPKLGLSKTQPRYTEFPAVLGQKIPNRVLHFCLSSDTCCEEFYGDGRYDSTLSLKDNPGRFSFGRIF